MKRILHLLPAGSTAFTKVLQLVLLAAISHVYLSGAADLMLVGYVLISSLIQLSDSGAIAYLLVNVEQRRSRSAMRQVLGIQTLTVSAGITVGLGCCIAFVGVREWSLAAVLLILALSQLADGLARIMRSSFLVQSDPVAFAVPELIASLSRATLLAIAIALSDPLFLALSALPSAAVIVYSWVAVSRGFSDDPAVRTVRSRDVLGYGVSGTVSALYSQAPVMLSSVLLPVSSAAPFSVGYRLAQSAEFLPATFAQQLLPRVRDNLDRSQRRIALFAGLGVVVAVALWLLRDVLAMLIAFPEGTETTLLILVLALPFRFANHYLISLTMALSVILQRTVITLGLAVVVIAATLGLVATDRSFMSLAVVAGASEAVLFVALLTLTAVAARRRQTVATASRALA